MQKEFNTTQIFGTDHSTYGGFIYSSDFNTDRGKKHTNGSAIAYRIANDQKFDEQCRKNIVNRQNYGGNKDA